MRMKLSALLVPLLLAVASLAQTYPTTNPVYIPNADKGATAYSGATDVVINTNGVSTVAVQISGTITTLTTTIRGSVDGTNYVTLRARPCDSQSVYQTSITAAIITAQGNCWRVNASGFKKIQYHATVATGAQSVYMVGAPHAGLVASDPPVLADPCADPNVLKSSAVINIGAAATTKIVDTSGTTTVYVCGWAFTLAGTTPTFAFNTGTHVSADCDTTPAARSGTIAPTTGLDHTFAPGHTAFTSIAGGQVCGTTVGTGSSAQGVLTFVQK